MKIKANSVIKQKGAGMEVRGITGSRMKAGRVSILGVEHFELRAQTLEWNARPKK